MAAVSLPVLVRGTVRVVLSVVRVPLTVRVVVRVVSARLTRSRRGRWALVSRLPAAHLTGWGGGAGGDEQ